MFLWELKNGIISTNLRELCVIETPKPSRKIPPTVASTSSATKSFITRCLSLSKAHYFYCIKIRALYRTSLMFLWEIKNTIILQNLRELCVIKINTNIPHIVASTSSATNYFITRCLSLLKAHSHFSSRCLSLSKAHSHFSSRCLSLLKARSYSSLWFRLRSITVLFITTLGAWACRRHILTSNLGAWACRRHIISITLKSVHF